jgi:hypothetical protein
MDNDQVVVEKISTGELVKNYSQATTDPWPTTLTSVETEGQLMSQTEADTLISHLPAGVFGSRPPRK